MEFFQPLRPLAPHLNLQSFELNEVEILWMASFSWGGKKGFRILNWALSPPAPDICPFSFGSVAVLVVCGCVSPMLAVPSTQSHHPCVTPGSISRLFLCWFQIRHWLAGISQTWGLYSLSFCLVLSFPLSFCRARPSVDSEAASFLVVTSSDFCLRGLICPFWYTTRMPPRILKSNSCL